MSVNSAYLAKQGSDNDDSEVLISRSTWSLKVSGLLFAGLLVLGRTATYGNLTWTPTFHPASSPLEVITSGRAPSAPAVPKSSGTDFLAAVKRSASEEVVVFNAGDSGEGGGHDGNHSHDGKGAGDNHSTDTKSQHSNENHKQH